MRRQDREQLRGSLATTPLTPPTTVAARRTFLKQGGALALTVGALPVVASLFPSKAQAENIQFFQIGTGPTSGTYFPVGGLIANAISNPPGSRPCEKGGSCGYEGLIGVAVSTEGSVYNVNGVGGGALQSALCQADVAHWAYTGSGLFEEAGPQTELRSIANLFPESVHLVARRRNGIREVKDLRGKRVALGLDGSGTRVDANLILKAYGVKTKELEVADIDVELAVAGIRDGSLDAFFLVSGTPARAVSDLANDVLIDLVPIDGPAAETLRADYPFFSKAYISAAVYEGIASTNTLAVGAQWLVAADIPEDIVYQSTFAMWHDNARVIFDKGHPKAALIQLDTALDGLGAPLHPGAERYYREIGLLTASGDIAEEAAGSDVAKSSEAE